MKSDIDSLVYLAGLLKEHNAITDKIARLIDRPAEMGHIGEYIAAAIFDISLVTSASQKSMDGYFTVGLLAGLSVNIKWYRKWDSLLDITPQALPNYYLVMTGPKSFSLTSRSSTRPAVIDRIYLFDAAALYVRLLARNVKIGVATSITKQLWHEAELYPEQNNPTLNLSDEQKRRLALFHTT